MSELIPNYQHLVHTGRLHGRRCISTRLKLESHEIPIMGLSQYYETLSKILRREIRDARQLQQYLVQCMDELHMQEQVEGLQPSCTFYQFLKRDQSASLQFRYRCLYQACDTNTQRTRSIIVTDAELEEAKAAHRLASLRTDELVLNVLYHVVHYLHRYSEKNSELLKLLENYQPRYQRAIGYSRHVRSEAGTAAASSGIEEQLAMAYTHIPLRQAADAQSFFAAASKITGLEICTARKMADVAMALKKLLNFQTLKEYTYTRTGTRCNCQFPEYRLGQSTSRDVFSKIIVGGTPTLHDILRVLCTFTALASAACGIYTDVLSLAHSYTKLSQTPRRASVAQQYIDSLMLSGGCAKVNDGQAR